MPNLKPVEILLIALVVLLLFGAKRLPDLARSVGQSLKILKAEVKDLHDVDDQPANLALGAPATSTSATVRAGSVPPVGYQSPS